LQRLMRDGRVRILGRPARPSYTVRGGEHIEIELPASGAKRHGGSTLHG